MKKKITLTWGERNELPIITIHFTFDYDLKEKIKGLGCYWSQELRCWWFPYDSQKLMRLVNQLSAFGDVDASKILQQSLPAIKKKKTDSLMSKLSEENQQLILAFESYLLGKRFSQSTVKTYGYLVTEYLVFSKSKDEISLRSIESFIENVFVPKNTSISTHRQFLSAMKHFLEFRGLELALNFKDMAPQQDRKLPNVLSKSEIIRLIQVTKNLKHRVCITLLYSSGLRIGELLNLRPKDLDFERAVIKIVKGKGRKDRYVPMAESIKPMLFNYLHTYRPESYLISGGSQKQKYTQASVRKFLYKYCRLAQIQKKVTPHTLRHSYATHLLESGMDIRYIQELLGHSKPETTMIYTHVRSEELRKLTNPLDLIVEEFRKEKQNSYLSE